MISGNGCFFLRTWQDGDSILELTDIASVEDCQIKCQEDGDCQSFNYNTPLKNCLLRDHKVSFVKTYSGHYYDWHQWVLGPKYC